MEVAKKYIFDERFTDPTLRVYRFSSRNEFLNTARF
jgi:hypothetical protein